MENTKNEEQNENTVKGPVFLDIDFGQNKVLSAGEFTTDRFEEFGMQDIGRVQNVHNIIGDDGKGFRIIEDGNEKKVEEMTKQEVQRLVGELNKIKDKDVQMPIKQSEIDLIEKETGYRLTIKDKARIIDDVNER